MLTTGSNAELVSGEQSDEVSLNDSLIAAASMQVACLLELANGQMLGLVACGNGLKPGTAAVNSQRIPLEVIRS